MKATIQGCDIVCPSPIGSAPSSYAAPRSDMGRNASRGISSIAARTRSSSIPRPRNCRSTIWRRASVDVVPEGSRVMHDDLATLRRDESLALERRQETAGALARGTGQLRDVRLGRLDQDVALRGA